MNAITVLLKLDGTSEIISNRRNVERGEGFSKKAVASFTRKKNAVARLAVGIDPARRRHG